ncbi:bifunctional riboflavin kinase/FAD synthetase [Flavobacterium sp. MAH-1]|uniref:Riboflavin biosynthesis protein n=1 Tax=Flavobacterium agri TaxID=2743471 RepID=A0A7Y8Y330_9FLAO|nr:bifunctional riboflavin kinase/FAD synthetase [Flavobacterium agri]NUY80345.1 bifunctional riboflavin kinase/FAD synthetase [Flavobacterium agri]NYA70370.1 bifunctional riboflavin kinase/FAD synthetase [Flavobacterium agri]
MKIVHSIEDFVPVGKTILTLGTFDGVHIGHRKIIARLLQTSEEQKCESVILTFFPHPRMVLQSDSEIKLLNTMPEKAELLEQAGLENLVIHPFDKAFSRLTAEEFVKTVLVDRFNICKIIIGHDHRFGRNRTATIDDLVEYGHIYGFGVEQLSAEEIDEVSVSSTKIREALLNGNMALANQYLGYDYFLTATVVKGKQLGRTIGFPTANLDVSEPYKLIPKQGVYVVESIIDGKHFKGMMNIGTNPTVGGQDLSVEVNFLDFDGDLYGKELKVSILHRLRNEEKFASIEILKQELAKDRIATIEYFKHR